MRTISTLVLCIFLVASGLGQDDPIQPPDGRSKTRSSTLPPAHPAASDIGECSHISPSKAYGVIANTEDGRTVKADLVALPGKTVLKKLVEPDMPVSEMDLKWNSSSTQVAYYDDINRGGSTTLYAIQGNSVTQRSVPEVKLPVFKQYGTRIKRQPYGASIPKNWIDDRTLVIREEGRLMIVEKNGSEPYWIDYKYEVTLSCPLEGTIKIAEIKKISVERVME